MLVGLLELSDNLWTTSKKTWDESLKKDMGRKLQKTDKHDKDHK
jgi:hypothetical protein